MPLNMKIIEKHENRDQLLTYAKHCLVDIDSAIEVGTWKGAFALKIIATLKPSKFSAVDPYELFPGMVSAPSIEYNNQESLDQLAINVTKLLEASNGRLIREKSVDAASRFQDNSIDFVYIDGDHTLEGIQADINAWWPKVKTGGIFCGDDYNPGKTGKGFKYGVVEGVNDFAQKNNLDVITYTLGQRQWLIHKK